MAHSNYSDKRVSQEHTGALTEHRLNFGNDARGFTPTAAEGDKPGHHGNLVENSTGDWSWKPARDRAMGYGKDSRFQTFNGVPPSAAELYRGQVFARA